MKLHKIKRNTPPRCVHISGLHLNTNAPHLGMKYSTSIENHVCSKMNINNIMYETKVNGIKVSRSYHIWEDTVVAMIKDKSITTTPNFIVSIPHNDIVQHTT